MNPKQTELRKELLDYVEAMVGLFQAEDDELLRELQIGCHLILVAIDRHFEGREQARQKLERLSSAQRRLAEQRLNTNLSALRKARKGGRND